MEKQYFDFPSLYRKGTAFVDAGCYDASNSYAFSTWCGGDYSQIFAFGPDPSNYAACLEKAKSIPNFNLIKAGLAERSGTAKFIATGDTGLGSGHLRTPNSENTLPNKAEREITIQTTMIDEVVGDTTVGMIKMAVEGMEFATLQGAEHTIQRDKPLLAICVFSRPGDAPVFMDYLQRIVPEYRFLLRQYAGPTSREAVLYASVDL